LWLEARAGQKNPTDLRHIQFEAWMDGFLSGYNWWSLNAPAAGIYQTDVVGARAFLDKYCHEHPTQPFVAAVAALITDQGGK